MLETEARLGGDDCASVEECVGGVTGFVGDLFGQETCAEVEVPCPGEESHCNSRARIKDGSGCGRHRKDQG